ncbi:MAG: hypothetical protein B6240_06770 [Desulfobacteraceae bacterium 4572_87]|nr:MAG: hypothetical protein B6240_06770 [Desulfobacteraceae bacterium 4572_87]
MDSQGLIALMNQVEEKGMDWDTVTEKIKIPYQVLSLYSNSGPVEFRARARYHREEFEKGAGRS